MEPIETIKGRNWLEFAGIDSPSLYMIPREQQFAEKLHAYTLPRPGAANSRVRDLVDMVLLIQSGTLRSEVVSDAVRITFQRRKTHDLPKALAQPPEDWERPFSALAKECGVLEDANGGFTLLDNFLGAEFWRDSERFCRRIAFQLFWGHLGDTERSLGVIPISFRNGNRFFESLPPVSVLTGVGVGTKC